MFSVGGTGRLTKGPELRYTGKGTAVCNLDVAVNERVKGREEKIASFFSIVAFGKAAEWLGQNLEKGERVEVHGCLRQDRFKRKDGTKGQKVFVLAQSVQRLDWKNGNAKGSAPEKEAGVEAEGGAPVDADIPF